MDEKNQLLLGIDLGKQASQITCFDRTEYEAVPLGREINGEMVYEFPMALKWLKARERGAFRIRRETVVRRSYWITCWNIFRKHRLKQGTHFSNGNGVRTVSDQAA